MSFIIKLDFWQKKRIFFQRIIKEIMVINPNSLKNLRPSKKGMTNNPKWPPKRGVSLFLHQCQENWIEQATKQDIEATYMSLVNLDDEWLKKAQKDIKQPIIVRKLAEFIINSYDINIFERMLDRWIWKAKQIEEIKQDTTIEFIIKE